MVYRSAYFSTSAGIAPNVIGLGEVAFVRWLVCRKAILPNPCYALVAVFSSELQSKQGFFLFFVGRQKIFLINSM